MFRCSQQLCSYKWVKFNAAWFDSTHENARRTFSCIFRHGTVMYHNTNLLYRMKKNKNKKKKKKNITVPRMYVAKGRVYNLARLRKKTVCRYEKRTRNELLNISWRTEDVNYVIDRWQCSATTERRLARKRVGQREDEAEEGMLVAR